MPPARPFDQRGSVGSVGQLFLIISYMKNFYRKIPKKRAPPYPYRPSSLTNNLPSLCIYLDIMLIALSTLKYVY